VARHFYADEEVVAMSRRWPVFLLACFVLGMTLSMPSRGASEGNCPCNDRPRQPCLRQQITLEGIDFELGDTSIPNAAHTALYETSDSEVWVLIETVPSGACRACAQTYVLYAPERDVKSDKPYSLFSASDPSLTASRTVFLMTECTVASSLSIRIAIIEEDDSYAHSLAYLAPYLTSGLLFGETGSRAATAAEATGWSARLDGAWLDSLVSRLTLHSGNDVVLPASHVSFPVMDGYASTTAAGVKYGTATHWVSITLRGESTTLPSGQLKCDMGDSPTQAETHLSGTKLCELSSHATTADPGYTEVTASSALPSGVVKQSTSVKKETYTRGDGSKVELIFMVRVVEFADGSIYVEVYSMKRVIATDGTVVETVRDCLQSTSLRGFDRSKIRSLLETATPAGVVHTLSGGSPQAPLSLSTPMDAACGIASTPDHLVIALPSGAVLDATGLQDSAALVQAPHLLAWQSVTIWADEIALPAGATLESTIFPAPRRLAAIDSLALWVPEAVSVGLAGDRLDVVVANRSGAPSLVSLSLADDLGWVAQETREVSLASGQVAVIAISVTPGSSEAVGTMSRLSLAATAEGLTPITVTVELRLGAQEEAGTQQPTGRTVATTSVPENATSAARTLAWKGGYLGRSDPSQRWDASENDPSQFCEPCGHTPMCVLCMEWDLQQWQLARQKSLSDLVALMGLISYLASVKGSEAYDAVAAVYWDSHWDGWHNRDRPW
jgi:hypothetical protein